MSVSNRKELTAEEKALSYSKYYYMEMAKPDQAILDRVLQGPIDPKDALRREDANDLLNPGYLASEFGYCVMPDGAGYISTIVKMPGVTPEMLEWFFWWQALHPLRWKICHPDDHFDGLPVSDEERKRLLDPNIPLRERNWGVPRRHRQYTGDTLIEGKGAFQSPEEFDFDMTRFKPPNVATALCSCGFLFS